MEKQTSALLGSFNPMEQVNHKHDTNKNKRGKKQDANATVSLG